MYLRQFIFSFAVLISGLTFAQTIISGGKVIHLGDSQPEKFSCAVDHNPYPYFRYSYDSTSSAPRSLVSLVRFSLKLDSARFLRFDGLAVDGYVYTVRQIGEREYVNPLNGPKTPSFFVDIAVLRREVDTLQWEEEHFYRDRVYCVQEI